MLEPLAKNTAPAILAAATKLYNFDKEAVILVTPSDHHIPKGQLLADTVIAASPAAEGGAIVTFGIQPDRAETGYGYIEKSEELLEMGMSRQRFMKSQRLSRQRPCWTVALFCGIQVCCCPL